LWLEALEDRTLPSATNPFYDLTTLASTAIPGTFGGQSFGNLPAINDQGRVAFVTNNASGNGIYLAGQGPTQNVTASFTAINNSRTYGRGVALNDQNYIVARDQIGTQYLVREWNGNTTDESTDLFHTPVPVLGNPDNNYISAQTFTAINDANGNNGTGDVAFVALDAVNGVRDVLTESGANLGDGTYRSVLTADANGANPSPRPELTSDGQVLYVTPDGNLYLARTSTDRQFIAGAANGFTSIDPGAAVSKDGRVIVFTGNRGRGEGLFAAYYGYTDPGVPGQRAPTFGWNIVYLAGEGMDSFTSFDTTGDLAVNSTLATDRGVTVAFKATDSRLGTGIYAIRLSLFPRDPAEADPFTPVGTYASGAMPVALDGEALGSGAITDVELGQGINDVGRGQIAFWAQTSNGQAIVLANPHQVIWLDFGLTSTTAQQKVEDNEQLLDAYRINDTVFSGTMAQTLPGLGVNYDAATLQNAIVAAVKRIYTNAGVPVTVLGSTTDTPPAYVPEPILHSDGVSTQFPPFDSAGVYQTIEIGGAVAGGTKLLGLASPLTSNGLTLDDFMFPAALDFYNQIPDDPALVFLNNILNDPAYQGTPPSALSQAQIVNGIATIIAHESGHNFGLFHLQPTDGIGQPITNNVMIEGTSPGEFNSLPQFSSAALPVFPYDTTLDNVTESSILRLGFATGAPQSAAPDPALLAISPYNTQIRANIGFPAANTLNVQHLYIGVASSTLETPPSFQDLGSGDLATLLNKAHLSLNPDDQLIVLGSTNGSSIDIVGVGQGQEGAQDLLPTTLLGLTTDSQLQVPVTGSGAAFHVYQLTSSGDVDLGLAPIQATPVNHAQTLAPIRNQAVTFGSTVTFTASATDPDQGQTLTYSLDKGAPTGASIDSNTGAFTWKPTAAQAGQVYTFNVVVTDNGTPPLSATQPVTINVENRLQVIGVTEITTPTPGPMQIAVDFNEALQPTPAQTVSNYKIVSQGGVTLPIGSAVYSDNGTQHRVVLTIAAGVNVIPDVYHVSIDAPNLTATNGDTGEAKADQLWVDVTSENTL
jgi:hypothetical protein